MSALIFHERFGDVTRAQLAAYRKFNVSQSDHSDLVDAFGEDDHAGITAFVKRHSESGMYSVLFAAGTRAEDEEQDALDKR